MKKIHWTVLRTREGWHNGSFVQSKRLERFLDETLEREEKKKNS